MIFFTSDLHFGHNKNFLYEPRGFKSINEHDEHIIMNWNETVKKDDIVYVLGDLIMGTEQQEGLEKIRKLNGKIVLIRGNHDSNTKYTGYKTCFNIGEESFNDQFSKLIKYNKKNFYLSHYPVIIRNDYLKEGKEKHTNLICLHGHTHSKDKFEFINFGCYNIGLDAHNNRPVSIDDICSDMTEYLKNNAI